MAYSNPLRSRREWIQGALLAAAGRGARLPGPLVESHIHLFAGDTVRFPYSPTSYTPQPEPVESYVKFAQETGIDHAVIVHPEPYQDDHRYLEYCLAHEPVKGFFKGTCLFDPLDRETPKRMRALVKRNPEQIVALRIHEVQPAGTPPPNTGAIKNRDLRNPQMFKTWKAAHQLGLGVQMHCIPHYAPMIAELAVKIPQMPLILDHLARPGQGTPEEYDQVLKLSQLPRCYMKFSTTGVVSASKQPFPHLDAKPIIKRVFEAFGPDRLLWGELGTSPKQFERAVELFDTLFDFASAGDRAKIRGTNAQKLFRFV